MDMMSQMFSPLQSMAQSLYLHYKLGRALLFMYLAAQALGLVLTTVAALNFGVDPLIAFLSLVSLCAVNTLWFLLSFSYFLFNIVRPRPHKKYF